jgi:uncharacterized protein
MSVAPRSTIPLGLGLLMLSSGVFGGALVDAAKLADASAVRALIAKGTAVDEPDADGSTALHWAAYVDDLESARALLAAGADVNAATDLGVTPLWAAAQNGAALTRLLLDAGARPNAALLSGETPLMAAARSGLADVAELLLGRGADVDARAGRGQTALMWAAAQRHPEVVAVLIAHGANVGLRSETWSQMMAVPPHGYREYNREIPHGGNTALLFAARSGDLASARHLVGAGADIDAADAWGVTATVMAAHSGYTEMVEWFLAEGADPNLAGAGFSALHIAILRRDARMARALLARGADPDAPLAAWTPTRRSSRDFHFRPELVGATPFWLAARFQQPEIMRLLLSHGADPRLVHRAEYVSGTRWERRTEEATALMAAVGMGGGGDAWVPPQPLEREQLALEAVKLAWEAGVDVNFANAEGRTALSAAKGKYPAVAAFLTAKGGQ